MQTLNLVPDDCIEGWMRRRRLVFWAFGCLVVTIVAVTSGVQRWAAGRAIVRLEQRVAATRARGVDLERSLVLAAGAHDDLLARAEAVAALQQTHDLPRQLAMLSKAAPDGVVFTRIESKRTGASGRSRLSRGAPAGESLPDAKSSTEMAGYAVSHRELDRLIHAMEEIPNWTRVRLLRASREPLQAGQAIAFRLVCTPAEHGP